MVRLLYLAFLVLLLPLASALDDGDADGIEDSLDVCPQTPLGSLVLSGVDSEIGLVDGCSCYQVRELLVARYGNHPDDGKRLHPCVVVRCDEDNQELEIFFPETSSEPLACPEDFCEGNNRIIMKDFVFANCKNGDLDSPEELFLNCREGIEQDSELCEGQRSSQQEVAMPAIKSDSDESQRPPESENTVQEPQTSFNYLYVIVPFIMFIGGFFIYFLFKPTDVHY